MNNSAPAWAELANTFLSKVLDRSGLKDTTAKRSNFMHNFFFLLKKDVQRAPRVGGLQPISRDIDNNAAMYNF